MRKPLPPSRQPLAANSKRQQVAKGASIQAPVGGWDAVSSLADMPEDRAITLDNWFPRPDSVEVRKGRRAWSIIPDGDTIETLMVYNAPDPTDDKMFAANGGTIYDVTINLQSTATDQTSLQNDRWQTVNVVNDNGDAFLWICNGEDQARYYDGSAWTLATASASVGGDFSSDIIHVNLHQNRIWGVIKDSTKALYFPVGAITGAVKTFEFGGLFTKGGYLVAMATWTHDGGAGIDDSAVFISSKGQVAVYNGTDPNSANTWSLVGVYDLGPPIGRRCFVKTAGDIALLNIDGVLPLSRALQTDRAAAPTIAISANINNAFKEAAQAAKENFGWEIVAYPRGTMAMVNVPIQPGVVQHQYVMNTLTGAWCRFKNWNFNCLALFNDRLYGGGNDGIVYLADEGSIDSTDAIDAVGQAAYNYYKSRGVLKRWGMLRPIVTTDSALRPAVGLSTDFRDNASIGTPTAAVDASALYDTAIYDTDVYAIEDRVVADWIATGGVGQCASIHFRALTGSSAMGGGLSLWDISEWDDAQWASPARGDVTLRLNSFDITYEEGGFI